MIKESKIKSDLLELIKRNTGYKALYPYNLLYYDGSVWWADCVNLLKALFNGRDIYDYTVGSFQHDLSATGDCTEWGLISQCSDIRTTFDTLDHHIRVLYMSGHIGCYVGEYEYKNKIYNVVEATSGNLGFGIIPSYVKKNGKRTADKESDVAQGYWTYNGIPSKWCELDIEDKNDMTYSEKLFYEAIEKDIDVSIENASDFPNVTEYLRRYLNYYGYVKVINQKWTRSLTKKLRKWQRANGLPVTGHLRGCDLERMRDR